MKNSKNAWMYFIIIFSGLAYLSIFIAYEFIDTTSLLATDKIYREILDGRVLHFYDSIANSGGALNANVLMRLPLILLYFPGFCIAQILRIEFASSLFGIYWNKAIMVAFFLWSIHTVCKINKTFGKESFNDFAITIMIMSSLTMYSVVYAGQDEIIYVSFFLFAIRRLCEKQNLKFLIWSMISVSTCPIIILPFLLIELTIDKNLFSVISKLCFVAFPTILYTAVFGYACFTYRYAGGNDTLSWYFGYDKYWFGGNEISISLIFLIGMLCFAFFENKSDFYKKSFFLVAMSFGIIETLGYDSHYRKFIWLPFALIYVINHCKDSTAKVAMLLISIKDITITILSLHKYSMMSNFVQSGLNKVICGKFGLAVQNANAPIPNITNIDLVILKSVDVAILFVLAILYNSKIELKVDDKSCWRILAIICLVFPTLLIYNTCFAYGL